MQKTKEKNSILEVEAERDDTGPRHQVEKLVLKSTQIYTVKVKS